MKKLLLSAFALALSQQVYSQTYTPIAVTGYTADVVANGAGTVISSTTHDVDGVNYNFVTQSFVNPANASPTSFLPASGLITSAVSSTPGLTYQLAPYTGNNSLRLSGVSSGTLTFPTPTYADQIFVLATSGSGATSATVTVTFADNTTQEFPLLVNDWYDAAGFAIQGISRVNRNNDAIENSATNPRLYQYLLPVGLANTSRAIQSITFNKTNATGLLNVMGITVRGIAAPVAVDAAIVAVSPATLVLTGVSQPVTATLMNQGTSPLTSATLTWTVDGVAQPNVTWTGNLAPNQSATVALGNYTFTSGTVALNVCATVPNDGNTANNCLLNSLNSCNVLTGTYTIDKTATASPTTYTSIASAVAAMSSCGISGPVTFNVVAGTGPYTEQVEIPAITGTSATNTVTFNGNGNTVSADPATGNRAVIRLNGADFVTINNFVIATTGTATGSFGWGIHFINNADNNTISNNTITIGSLTTSESTASGIVFSNSNTVATTAGETGSNNLISNNTITGGTKGIALYGVTTSTGNNRLTGNTIKDFYTTAIEINGFRNTLAENNDISRAGRVSVNSTSSGIILSGGTYGSSISKNRIHNTHDGVTSLTGTQYGIYSNANDAPAGYENLVKNNLIYNFSNNSTQYGLYNSNSDGVFYYHNTINLDRAANTGTVRGFYQLTAASNIRVQNNNISIIGGATGTKHAIYYGTTSSAIRSNNNNLYVTSPVAASGVGFFTSNRLTLADWRTGSGDDSISVSLDPQFTQMATGNFLPANPALDNQGLPVSPAVTDDITNALRNPTTPDLGAYEIGTFTPTTVDAGVTAMIDPVSGCNLTNQEQVTITISNFGTATLTTIPVTYTHNTATPVTETFTGSIAPGATANYTFSTRLNLTAPGTHTITASTVLPTDAVASNNAITKVVTATAPAAVPVITAGGPVTFCTGGSVTLTAASTTSGATYTWFNNGTAIAGATAATYTANASGSYTAVATANACPSAASAATTVTINAAPATPTFTASGNTVFCNGGTVTFTATSTTPGVTYQWFNNGTALANATNATYTASASGSYTVNALANGCSATSAATTVTVNTIPATPVVTASGLVLTSNSASGNQWLLNGNPIPGATNATYTSLANGTYTVIVTANGCASTASNAIVITNTGVKESELLAVKVYPNPSTGEFQLELPAGQVYELTVTDLTGRVILTRQLTHASSILDLKGTAQGIYLLHLQSNGHTATRKLILE